MSPLHHTLICLFLFASTPCGSSAQALLTDDFNYPAGDSLRAHGWNLTGSTVNCIFVTSPGLTYPGYRSGNSGNATTLAGTGQDLNRGFSSSDSLGSVYAFFLVNVLSAQTGDYFFHFIQKPVTGNVFAAKVYIRRANNGNLAFGIAKRSNLPSFSDSLYALNTTYLLVVKYTFNAGATNNDVVSLYVFQEPDRALTEPHAPQVGPVADSSRDATCLDFVGLRQGSASTAPTLRFDGLMVRRNWEVPTPVQISTFLAHTTMEKSVHVEWTTQSEINNFGFMVERSWNKEEGFAIVSPFIPGHGTTLEEQRYSFTDDHPLPGVSFYRLQQIDLDQTLHFFGPIAIAGIAGIPSKAPRPSALSQNCPNPFNPSTEITFVVASTGHARLAVYDVLGRQVEVLFDGLAESGTPYRSSFAGPTLPGGVYFYRLTSSEGVKVRKMLKVK